MLCEIGCALAYPLAVSVPVEIYLVHLGAGAEQSPHERDSLLISNLSDLLVVFQNVSSQRH